MMQRRLTVMFFVGIVVALAGQLQTSVSHAAIMDVYITESGGDLEFTFTGSVDVSNYIFGGTNTLTARSEFWPAKSSQGLVFLDGTERDWFIFAPDIISNPHAWAGTLVDSAPTSNSGIFGIIPGSSVTVPAGYVSGDLITGTATLAGADYSSFSASPNQTFTYSDAWNTVTLHTAAAPSSSTVPEPSSLAIFGLGACIAGLGYRRRKRRVA